MQKRLNLKEMNAKIRLLKDNAEELRSLAGAFPAVLRNTDRILASIRMLELNVSEAFELEQPAP